MSCFSGGVGAALITTNKGLKPQKVVLVSVNSAWNVANFRAGLVKRLQAAGYRVIVATPNDPHVDRVRALGCEWVELPINAKGINPFGDMRLFLRYWRTLRSFRPIAYLGFTIKPNVYGSLAAGLLGVPAINNIAGLGTTFLRNGWLNWIAKVLYRFALRRSHRVFFQNGDDQKLFVRQGLVDASQSVLLPGSGVDLQRFTPVIACKDGGSPLVALMCARLLWDKGVQEFVDATRTSRARGVAFDARVLGFLDVANPSALPRENVEAWQREGLITYLGEAEDVRPMLGEADVVVLPSYYPEGTPRSLLEAAAMGKPIITTDSPGCRDVVREGLNGYLVPVRDAGALAEALSRFYELSMEQRAEMGRASRALVEERYDERIVVEAYLLALAELPEPPTTGNDSS